ncbi:MAG: hypothetical protein ACREOD_06200 [Candidatus Dormibacteria bacterium]
MADRPAHVVPAAAGRRVAPSKLKYRREHRNITLSVPLERYDAIQTAARAAGGSVPAFVLGDLADRDRLAADALAAGHDEGVAAGRREGQTALTALRGELQAARQELAALQAAIPEQVREATQLAVERALADADSPASRAASHRRAAQWEALERMEAQWAAEDLAASRARQLRAECDLAEQQDRLDRLHGDRGRELEAARAKERETVQRAALVMIATVQEELALQFQAALEAAETEAAPLRAQMRQLQQALARAEAARDHAIEQRDMALRRAAQGDPVRQHLADALAASRRQLAESSARRDFWMAHHRYPTQEELAEWLEAQTRLPLPDGLGLGVSPG